MTDEFDGVRGPGGWFRCNFCPNCGADFQVTEVKTSSPGLCGRCMRPLPDNIPPAVVMGWLVRNCPPGINLGEFMRRLREDR